jgi:hypothetical protein
MSEVYRRTLMPAIIDFSPERKSEWPTVLKAVLMTAVKSCHASGL